MTEVAIQTIRKLPERLKNPAFRFYLCGRNSKIPTKESKLWNSENNFKFFEPILIGHILKGKNVGIVTGFGNLIVIDFDCPDYQKQKENLLPLTFTTRTAGKGLKHFYYILQVDMIKKIGIYIDNKRVCDIQADRCGIICPPSTINRKSYDVIEDAPIAEIDYDTLSRVFGIQKFRIHCERKFEDKPNPKAVQEALGLFKKLGIPRNGDRHFKCPYHKSVGGHCLWIDPKGSIFCFHCQRHWKNANMFEALWGLENMEMILV